METPRPRLRIRLTTWPRRALILTETPRPDCPRCEGDGGTAHDYGDYETGEYAGTDYEPCFCWNEDHRWTLLPLPRRPRWLRRQRPDVDPWAEPPF